VREMVAQQNAAANGGRPKYPTAQEVDQMVNDRQKVADDLGRLTQQLRGAARELAPTQPKASNALRGAISGLDENNLGTRLQKSSDGLRSGNFSDPLETAMTNDLQKLGQQVREAARDLGTTQQASQDTAINRAMDDLSRLRDQLDGLGGRNNQQGPRAGQQPNGQPGGQQYQPGELSRNGQPGQQGQSGQQSGQQGSQAGQQGGQGGQQGGRQNGQGNPQAGGGQAGEVGNRVAGGAVNGGGGTNRNGINGGWDTGNTRITGQAVAPQRGANPADTQRQIEQGLNLLNQVRSAVQDSPEAKQELQALIDQMRNLDPSRFPGNPGLVEQMHQQLVSQVDLLELQLRRQLEEGRGGTIRNPDPTKVPAGYQQSVAEYYRKLSSGSR